ncbi:MAG: AAA family ATPase, partial [Mycobacteriales bacterium]
MRRARGRGDGEGDEPLANVVPLVKPVPAERHASASHLPSFWSSFVGRERELDEVRALLSTARFITLTGPGGIGKTRLAVEVAMQQAASRRVYFVDLAPLTDGHLVGERVAAAFGLGELRGRNLAELVAPGLMDETLLVLDNCEHVIAACAALVRALLAGCPSLRVLGTSQQRLGVSGELVWTVPPLEVPDDGADAVPEALLRSTAVRLFCERAAAVRRDFVASPANLDAIAEICRRLDANPLAIELAAARVEALAPAEISARLEQRLHFLGRGVGTSEGRHQTLAAALAWSHDLLREPEQMLLRRLAVFPAGFSRDAVEEVCAWGDVEREDVLELLSAVVAKSLVFADTSGSSSRYRLLETVRHYAWSALDAAG